MHATSVAMPLMKFALGEVKRRGTHSTVELLQRRSQAVPAARRSGSSAAELPTADLEELVRVLQRSENHLLATRVLYGSWCSSDKKAQVCLYIFCWSRVS